MIYDIQESDFPQCRVLLGSLSITLVWFIVYLITFICCSKVSHSSDEKRPYGKSPGDLYYNVAVPVTVDNSEINSSHEDIKERDSDDHDLNQDIPLKVSHLMVSTFCTSHKPAIVSVKDLISFEI